MKGVKVRLGRVALSLGYQSGADLRSDCHVGHLPSSTVLHESQESLSSFAPFVAFIQKKILYPRVSLSVVCVFM